MSIELIFKVRNSIYKTIFLFSFLAGSVFYHSTLFAQEANDIDPELKGAKKNVAPVIVDGNILFNVSGISSYQAELRAETISKRIQKAAANSSIVSDSTKIIFGEDHNQIYAGEDFIMNVYEIDAKLEGISKNILSELFLQKAKTVIDKYRYERSKPVLIKHTFHALGSAVVMAVILFILLWFIKRIDAKLQLRIKERIESFENKSYNLIRSNQLWKAFHVFFKTLKYY